MRQIYSTQGLPFSEGIDFHTREYIVNVLSTVIQSTLLSINRQWVFNRIESPLIIPKEYIKLPYKDHKIYSVGDLRLRPETTEATYAYIQDTNKYWEVEPPIALWQYAKSARPETDEDNMHLKEFYQLEYQCFYAKYDIRDYRSRVLPELQRAVAMLTKYETRLRQSETSPAYSPLVIDIEVLFRDKWIEVASILVRNDAPDIIEGGVHNLEIGFGVDRLVQILQA